LFNIHAELTLKKLTELTAIPVPDLKAALKYLCNPKQKILLKKHFNSPEFYEDEPI
jgi:hypothetical protein